jgi:two-component system cell cycle sensor histidine kinase/response regulator CckA
VLNDVTEHKSLEAQFVQSQKMQAIGQLAGGVAHDFNNLLTAISGHCDLLLLRHDQGDPDYGDLIQIHQNANRAASLVGQLLAFSRKQSLMPEIIDLRDALSDLTHLLNRLVGEKVRLTLSQDPALRCIRADKRQLEQVIMNLVVNARDAMPDGGEIRIETSNVVLDVPLERDRATVASGPYVVVRVIDQGTGIPSDKITKIFEPFYTTKRPGEGTGLGLSTAYGIVKQTGGFIFVDSTPGQGATFTLYFPAHDRPSAEAQPEQRDIAPVPQRKADGVVLLVEDEAPVRAFASRALRLRGYSVLEADSAEAALKLLADPDLAVDLFVTDVIMPGKDGPTWVREALADRPQTKVVFVSGYAEDAFAEHKASIPNSVFLPKPFSLTDLTQTVQRQLH